MSETLNSFHTTADQRCPRVHGVAAVHIDTLAAQRIVPNRSSRMSDTEQAANAASLSAYAAPIVSHAAGMKIR
jgi:hypothetical protein